ncbi:MAG: hypothetical protein ACXW11_02310 [Methylotenera sp.]
MNDLKGATMWLLDVISSVKEKLWRKSEPRRQYYCITCRLPFNGTESYLVEDDEVEMPTEIYAPKQQK